MNSKELQNLTFIIPDLTLKQINSFGYTSKLEVIREHKIINILRLFSDNSDPTLALKQATNLLLEHINHDGITIAFNQVRKNNDRKRIGNS